MMDRIGKEFAFLEHALALRQQRQELLASNIANADTPGYKARDMDFSAALRAAADQSMRLADTRLALTSARHIPAAAHTAGPGEALYRVPTQPSIDGNTVDMNTERVHFADNTSRYQADLSLIDQRIKSLLTAMQQ